MADDPRDPRELIVEAPGADEVAVLPWPLIMRARVRGRLEKSDRYPWLVLSAALVGLFSVGFSITVLSIVINDIAAEFGTSTNVMIWIITGPILLGAIVTPAAGKLADIFGARRVYLISMSCVAVFAALAAVSWDAGSLIAFRIVGAAIGAATGPASIALINRLFPAERRAQALGYWAMVAAGGPVVGVVFGGPLVEALSWRWVFILQVPFSLLTVLVCALVMPETPRNRGARFDFAGAILLASGTGVFVLALNRAPEPGWGWSHPLVVGGFLAAPVLLVAFYLYEKRITNQLVPIRYLRSRNVVLPTVNLFLVNFAYMGGFFLTPFLLENVLGYSDTKTGFMSIARPLVFAIVGPFAGWIATRIGERVNGIVGGVVIAASMAVFMTISSSTSEWVVLVALMLSGAGMGATAPAMSTAVANSVDEQDLGVAGGATQMMSQLGVVVGTQVMITVQQASASTSGDASSYAHGYLVGLAGAALAVLAATFVRPTVGRVAEARRAAHAQATAQAPTPRPVLADV